MSDVRVVTDSAADLSPQVASERRIRVVPLTITFANESFLDGVQLPTERFWDKLRSGKETPTTAAPGPGAFEEAYRELLEAGASAIVSVHLSSKLSATFESAATASKQFDGRVVVIDSLGVSAATGLMALRACELAAEGRTTAQIEEDLHSYRARMHLFATVDTLEYLRRGGRIGGAQALLGTMLQMKPVITLQEGTVELAGRVRTRQKALQHLAAIVREHAGNIERLIVLDGQAQDLPAFLATLRDVADVPPWDVSAFGPVVGTHTGPGVIGVVFVTGI